jgi:hypothetical protein
MSALKNILISTLIALLVPFHSDGKNQIPNKNAIWLWSTHMKEAPIQEWKDKGIGHVLLNEAAFWKHEMEDVTAFAQEYRKAGLKVHVWFQCFSRDKKWTFPVDEQTGTLKQDYFDSMTSRAEKYIKAGFDGIHMDYIRFCGNASKYNFPETGLSAVGIVNECCRQMHEAVKAINPDAILSAALMPEINSEHRYGQRPSEMAQWIDVLMPMIYRWDYYGENKDDQWVKELTSWFVSNAGEADVWVGIQTYSVNTDNKKTTDLKADEILAEYKLVKSAGADGVVLFRHGLGVLPDMREWF